MARGPHAEARDRGAVEPGRRDAVIARLRWFAWLLGGVALTAVAGYLVAALLLFPSPLLPNERQVGLVMGRPLDEAARELERRSLIAEVAVHEAHPTIPEGRVIWQDPPPGVAVPRGTAVQLTVSSGPPKFAVPDVSGYDPEFAQRMILAAGLRVAAIDTIAVKGAPPGFVGATTPDPGDSVAAGNGVTLHIVPGQP